MIQRGKGEGRRLGLDTPAPPEVLCFVCLRKAWDYTISSRDQGTMAYLKEGSLN